MYRGVSNAMIPGLDRFMPGGIDVLPTQPTPAGKAIPAVVGFLLGCGWQAAYKLISCGFGQEQVGLLFSE
jgi:hypothetical protein